MHLWLFISNEIHENSRPHSFELYKEFRHKEEIKCMEIYGIHRKLKIRVKNHVRFEAFTAAVMRSSVFWDMIMHSLLKDNRCFKGTYRLHLQCWRERWARNHLSLLPTSASFLLALSFNLEDGSDTFLWNVSWLSVDCIVSYSRRQNCKKRVLWILCSGISFRIPCHTVTYWTHMKVLL